MTKDLEETLAELGPSYRAVVDRLTAAREAPGSVRRKLFAVRAAALTAAGLLVLLGGAFWALSPAERRSPAGAFAYTAAYGAGAPAMARLVASQRADGSWESDFLTRQNAAALAGAAAPEGRIAYKKAVRYLRTKGLAPLTPQEFKARRTAAARFRRG
jgi:hypothetical protein